MTRFQIDSDIRKASTLPAEFYLRPEWYERTLEAVFARSWQFVCREGEIDNLFPQTLCEGSLDEPVLAVREGDSVTCVSNVCTHRGMILVEEPCRGDLIRCRYHGRRFSLDGRFLSMPEFEEAEDFPSESDDLAQIPSDSWKGFVFAGLDPQAPLEEHLDPLGAAAAGFDFEGLRLAGTRDYEVQAHWALYCENYLEGFHIPYVHPELNKIVEYSTYTTELFSRSSLQTARGGSGPNGKPPFEDGAEGFYYFIFPNTMFNLYPWGVSVNIVLPKGPSRTQVRYLTYVCDDSRVGSGAGGDLDTVELQDQAVVEAVQKGIRSGFYEKGRYSPSKETGTHHFHRLIASALGEFE
ncbi:MAG: aromatic ring-hydroxylating dioxygenase subunit alpha [Aridibacter famidurans]|nr:aromatic ring-hydroxylating dioxygenase subunit alpha [Aridibacter famidurans]